MGNPRDPGSFQGRSRIGDGSFRGQYRVDTVSIQGQSIHGRFRVDRRSTLADSVSIQRRRRVDP